MLARLLRAAPWFFGGIFLFAYLQLVIWSNHQPSQTNPGEYRPYSHEHHAQHSPVRHWFFHDAAGFFTFWLVIVGGLQVGLFLWQLGLIRESLDDAKIAADAAKESADTAKTQAEVAQATLTTMQDTAQRELRAYVGIVSGHLAFEMGDKTIKPKATIRIKNFGQTPAYNVSCRAGVRNAVEFSDELNKWMLTLSGKNTIFPDCDQRIMFRGDFNEVPGAGPVGIFVFGRITYKDAFGFPRWTNFRFTAWLQESMKTNPFSADADLAPCDEGNDAN